MSSKEPTEYCFHCARHFKDPDESYAMDVCMRCLGKICRLTWTKVEDELPPLNEAVLIYLEGGGIKIGMRSSDDYTHWMPLPVKPEDE